MGSKIALRYCSYCNIEFSSPENYRRHTKRRICKGNKSTSLLPSIPVQPSLPVQENFMSNIPVQPSLSVQENFMSNIPVQPSLPYRQNMLPRLSPEPTLPGYQPLYVIPPSSPGAPPKKPIELTPSVCRYINEHGERFNSSWKHPFTCLVSGPTCCGKTTWVKQFLNNNPMDTLPKRIVWCYSEWQPAYNDLTVEMHHGPPKAEDFRHNTEPVLLIMDDLMGEDVTELFSRGCHHWNVSVIHIVQNLYFAKGRTARINCHYIVLFKSPGDVSAIKTLARQLPSPAQAFMEAYDRATTKAHGYLLADLTQTTPNKFRLRGDIFHPIQHPVYVYKKDL